MLVCWWCFLFCFDVICGARANDLFNRVLFGGFGLSFVVGFGFEKLTSVQVLLVELGFF